jgi:mycothiol synthase
MSGAGVADPPASAPRVEVLRRLDPAAVAAVDALVQDVTEADGVRPISEHATLHLRHGGDTGVRHLLVHVDGVLAGYLHLDVTDAVEGSSAELAVRPAMRGRGIGRMLVLGARDASPDGRLRLWAHGEQSGARGLAESLGFTRMRTLWQMRRSLFGALPAPLLPSGVRIRTFVPGSDDAAWVALNNTAFAGHPEQGTWSVDDLRQRIAEPWFDPAGFFLAVRGEGADERLVGFHWTKVHGGVTVHQHDHDGAAATHVHDDGHGHEPLGEIYVLGVDPAEHGHGLGKALSLVGLRHLRAAGLPAAMLYVEADNAAAVALYSSLGFTRWDTDVMFRSS